VKVVKLLLGAGVVVAVVARLGTGGVLEGLRAVSPAAVAAALALGLLTTLASAARWCVVTRGLGHPLALPGALGDCYRAQFLNSVLPAGVLGDVHRAVEHGRRSGDLGRGVQGVVLERLAGQAVVVAVAAAVLLAVPGPLRGLLTTAAPDPATLTAATLVTAAVGLGLAGIPRVRRGMACLAAGARAGLGGTRRAPAVLALSLLAMAGHLALLVVAARAVGVPAGLGVLTPLLMASLLAMGLPVNLGGWGPREATTATAFSLAGLGADTGLAVAVAYGLLALLSTLPGLGVLTLRRTAQRSTPAPTNSPRHPFRVRPASVA
jgi:uncharacterized membrane protein YbhN (UPF0104 family)